MIRFIIQSNTDLNDVTFEEDEDEDVGNSLREHFIEQIKQRFDTKSDQASGRHIVTLDVFNNELYILSTLLDPRVKTLPFEGTSLSS